MNEEIFNKISELIHLGFWIAFNYNKQSGKITLSYTEEKQTQMVKLQLTDDPKKILNVLCEIHSRVKKYRRLK